MDEPRTRMTAPPPRRRLSWQALCLLGLLAAAPAQAQAPATDTQQRDWLSKGAETAGDAAKSVGDTLNSWWNDLSGKVTPSGPTSFLPAQITEDDKQFFAVLDAIGLKLKDVAVSKGLFPVATYHFVASREPTDEDIERAERLLRAYRDGADGFKSRAKQRIARATLDTVATKGFALASMDVTLSPWPDASYQVTARDKPAN